MRDKEERVILVDEENTPLGTEEKMKAHEAGKLHRAFSVFIFDNTGRMLLQRRALDKYHCPGLWTNTCCSHPRPGEDTLKAAHRRLKEEMGLECDLTFCFSFIYKAHFDNGLTEYEVDHVYTGLCDRDPEINPREVDSFQWITIDKLEESILQSPDSYTPWFKIALKKLK